MRKISSSLQLGSNAFCSSLELARSLPNGFSTYKIHVNHLLRYETLDFLTMILAMPFSG